ncbi:MULTISPECIES: hypothetical protein [unclassified Rhizobium]|jgi:hypothetical protein|nr:MULTISPECIES: hypothetical protein [unclassified Rhizobium]MDM9622617.1 hypothetical protein [Rhizobium sp. S96]
MFTILTVLTALISIMFVVSVASTVTALRRESEDLKKMNSKHSVF